jgi:hypothetical protein
VSEQHLDRYADEFVFRYSNRKTTDAFRTVKAIKKIEGKGCITKTLSRRRAPDPATVSFYTATPLYVNRDYSNLLFPIFTPSRLDALRIQEYNPNYDA